MLPPSDAVATGDVHAEAGDDAQMHELLRHVNPEHGRATKARPSGEDATEARKDLGCLKADADAGAMRRQLDVHRRRTRRERSNEMIKRHA
jgi:hypothetical protein